MTVRDAERIEYPSQTPMWLFCLSHCSANGESLRPARLRSKRWRSLDEDESTGWYTVEEKEPCSLLWSWWWRPQVYGWTRGTQKLATIFLSIYDEAPVTSHTRIRTYTHTHTQLFTYQRHLSSPLPPLLSIFVTKATTEWHFIPLPLDSLPPPLLCLRWGKINCKLPGWANRDMGKKVGMTR